MITFTLMSLATSIKDYVEITHKLIEIEPLKNYTEFGAIFTYFIFSIGDFFKNFLSFSFLKNIWSIPIIIPDIASAMISEISVLDSYFHNAFTFFDVATNKGNLDTSLVIFEKFIIGLLNSLFLILPTSTSHLITLRRFVIQGLEAGYMAGLGTLAGNFLWLSSIILGWRFFVIPWLSLDIFRYLLGFSLLIKYIWDSSKERRMVIEDLSKWKIFLLNFLLALTEQSCIYPFISNLSIGPDTSILEGFAADNYGQFLAVHGAYLFGILLGSFSLLQFTCWFWENPAFSFYLWITTKSSLKTSTFKNINGTGSYYKILNFIFLYATMLCAIASIPYYGLDYTITNPIGLVPQDRILDQKKSQSDPDRLITETAFLDINPTDKNSRIRDGVHARRERWKQRLIKYQAFDASLYDQGTYDFLTMEDLNYGFDRFWLRRKMRNHQIRFRLFPGPWMRSLKKQLNNPANQPLAGTSGFHSVGGRKQSLESKAATGPRVEFFRILFEQFYHPNFHDKRSISKKKSELVDTKQHFSLKPKENAFLLKKQQQQQDVNISKLIPNNVSKLSLLETKVNIKPGLIDWNSYRTNSALRKFVRNFNTRINLKLLNSKQKKITNKYDNIYSKQWKSIFSKIQPLKSTNERKSYQLFRNVAKQLLLTPQAKSLKLTTISEKLSAKERKLLQFRFSFNNMVVTPFISKNKMPLSIDVTNKKDRLLFQSNNTENLMLLRPLNIYLQKEQAFKRKLRYYSTATMRKLTIGNQAPYFKTLMKRGFYYHKPSLRWKKTLYVASMRRGFRKKSRKQLVLQHNIDTSINTDNNNIKATKDLALNQKSDLLQTKSIDITKPTHSYKVLGKRASRYRHQIYKDVLQHWYYSPFNRLLLKFDVDAFINRQPKSHFLTKNEERILHIRRLLLSEHYDTLRWYTYMQHYRTMKTNIGGAKSFANRTYNQQFQGTFKKIRHLFAITPKQGDFYTLKFDQPLYNENKQNKYNVYFHDELRPSIAFSPNEQHSSHINTNKFSEEELASSSYRYENKQSENVSYRDNNFSPLLLSKKVDVINQSSFLIGNQFLNEQNKEQKQISNSTMEDLNYNFIYGELFVKLIKECKKRVHDQTFLKNYITHRIEKREQLNQDRRMVIWSNQYLDQDQTKELNKRIEKLKVWSILNLGNLLNTQIREEQKINTDTQNKEKKVVLTTSVQKAVNDSIKASNKTKVTQNELNNAHIIKTENLILNKLNVINILTSENKKTTKAERYWLLGTIPEKTKTLLQNTISSLKPILLHQTQFLNTRTEKNLQWWRNKQRVITKRKNSRKRNRFDKQINLVNKKLNALSKKVEAEKTNLYKTLYGNYDISDYLLKKEQNIGGNIVPKITDSSLLRKKQDSLLIKQFESNEFGDQNKLWQGFFSKKLRKKASAKGRRYRSFSLARYSGATRKPRLILFSTQDEKNLLSLQKTQLNSQQGTMSVNLPAVIKLDNISNLKGSFITKEEKYINNKIGEFIKKDDFLLDSLKKSQIKKRRRHSWKRRMRQLFKQNHDKYRKRQISAVGKLRVMNKKLKKFKATSELKQWWWKSFLPRYLNNLEINTNKSINHIAFKPLSNSNIIPSFNTSLIKKGKTLELSSNKINISQKTVNNQLLSNIVDNNNTNVNSTNATASVNLPLIENQKGSIKYATTSLPFYAGWDESLRKFVVTNRLLSRRESGLAIKETLKTKKEANNLFTNTPIQGLNEGSFLYWQTEMPFNSYNIDQFITTNQSFYAPLGWRRFEFRHSILKTWINYSKIPSKANKNKTLIISIKDLESKLTNKIVNLTQEKINSNLFIARRIKKRYKLLKQVPNILMYSPTGPLLTEVLPSHYISVFDQQYRFPRNRYLKRNPLKTMKKTTLLAMVDSTNALTGINKEFTLRKRVKPRRKYHRKRFIKKDGLIFPRRTKFININDLTNMEQSGVQENLRWRPSSRNKQKRKDYRAQDYNKQKSVGSKKEAKQARVKTNPLRLRQLRRREFQQILKPIQRYIPRNGGFTWPGDYLRLEVVEMPKLKPINIKKTSLKRKIPVQPVGIMPRKYLIEKHNIKVLKKKLEKAHLSQQLNKVVKEYKNLIGGPLG
uniref:Hypothetical chloroplast protein RF1 n=1 Tax=Astrephomene gubernaculifera TaxID=47775 RepID=A0A7R6ZNS3_9CHLO|nr:hypothetical chloroplast protein RF1 [Astrephomene gubernaculifera]